MGISMSRDRYDAHAGRTLPLLAFLMLLKYGPAGAARPPVTAALIAANALVYFRPGDLDALLPRLRQVTFNPHLIIKYGDLRRFFLSAFYHTSEAQFFMNMTSLLRTGAELEASMGSSEFASMVVSLVGLSQGFTLLLSKGLLSLGNHVPYYHFSAGFSGVVLGMNVVLNARAGDVVWFGVAIPTKYVAWLELLLVQALNPEAHLVGNVGGILAGLAYLVLRRGTEPLDLMFSGIADIVSQPVRFAGRLLRSAAAHRPRRSVQGHVASLPRETGRSVQGHVASLPRETVQGMWGCTTCSYDNSRCADVCEMCSTPHQDRGFSRRRHLQEGGNRELSVEELSVEEIRRRRLQRFEK
ncbi:rhomboid-like protein 14, mitochondrial [Lolium rigidum]|uniref:rhomboid-like protein 14, mitochondrial n=1 Tax=Lolium rigidum TaxID=89674 RepID=UPI001F5D3BB5|nr:rhomboid-like protein 14, mitochondrial [Lolium rigidum]